jgi:hypothetical protein
MHYNCGRQSWSAGSSGKASPAGRVKLNWKRWCAASPSRSCPLRKREARGDTARAQRLWRGSWLAGRVPWTPRRWPYDWQREMIAGLSTQRYGALRRSTEAATAKAITTVADTVVGAGAYLQEKGGEGRTGNLAVWVRRYPSASLLIGLGVGFLLGRRLGNAATAQGS